jgi:phenylpropionate dioxygenase-like ring-hydroxylating dioxygenase large terminal subunit
MTAHNVVNDIPGDYANLKPGEARCPAPTPLEVMAGDAVPPPPVLAHESPQFLGEDDIDFSRYTSQEFFDREMEKVWTKVWQWACREEHIPQVGDYYVYEIGTYSVIVIRTEDGIKAYHNSCLHRGTKLRAEQGMGSARELRCPFHGWTWGINGQLKSVPSAWDFPHVKPEAFSLPEVRVGLWGGFVFINLDDNAECLESYLEVLPEHFKNWDMSARFIELHLSKELPCNWKAAIEAFLEAYHVLETHPQLMYGTGDANVQYDIYSDHIARYHVALGINSPHLKDPRTEQELVHMMLVADRTLLSEDDLIVKPGETARTVMARATRKVMSEKYDCDTSNLSDAETIDTIEYHVFPNMVLFPGLSLPMVYRFRPLGGSPDRTLFELLVMRPTPRSGTAPDAPECVNVTEEESYAVVPGIDPHLAHVYDQDTANLRAQQQGFKASKKGAQTLGNYQEVVVRHFENTIDKYVRG